MSGSIVLRGVRVHNLRNINVKIPHRKLVIITGVSGSGKSSLAFDTLYAEGQRRYVESFSAYARQFLERMDKPDVDFVEGMLPAIAIERKNPIQNRRSTVGTVTEINDYLRLLFARAGRTFCERCKRPVKADSAQRIVDQVLALPEGARFAVAFPFDTAGLGLEEALSRLAQEGFVRLMVGDEFVELARKPRLSRDALKSALVVVDRLVVGKGIRDRLADSVETALRSGGGRIVIRLVGPPSRDLRFSDRFECAPCGIEYARPEPLLFSFNSPLGACPRCQGFGHTIEMDMDAVIPDKSKTLDEGAVAPWTCGVYQWWLKELRRFASRYRIRLDVPFKDLSARARRLVIAGTPEMDGVRGFFRWLEERKYKMHVRVFLSRYRAYVPCAECGTRRLKQAALNVRVGGRDIAQVCALTAEDALRFFESLKLDAPDVGGAPDVGRAPEAGAAPLLLNEIRKRLDYMVRVGAGYLTLDRMCRTLSGGEMQRVCLTTALGSSLVNTLYVLDEPTIGLHPRDTGRLIDSLKRLRDLGNTVVVVEHDREMMKSGDMLIDLGPGAGERGGRVVYSGPVGRIAAADGSLTARYLKGALRIETPCERRAPGRACLVLKGARENNLKDIDVTIPLGLFVCVTGVSGSGKSSLVEGTLYGAVKRRKGRYGVPVGRHRSLSGASRIDDVVLVDQSPIGRTPRSNPVSYVEAYSPIRALFAATPQARRRGLRPGHFSFNVPGGRCDRCEGHGWIKLDMQFLADVYVTCEACQGKRFQPGVMDVYYKGRNIHDVLDMTVSQAIKFFAETRAVTRALKPLADTGLGYLRLGQPATTLSGGEAQRLKLAAYLAAAPAGSARKKQRLLFLFDEPTTGLHFDDIAKLLACFRSLLDAGHSVVVIEHNLDVIKCADHVIDLGPEGGEQGGCVVAAGAPEEIARNPNSHTGFHLRKVLE